MVMAIEAVFVVPVMLWADHEAAAIVAMAGLVVLVVAFAGFLLAMVQDRAGRRPWIVVVYTLVNIASLICLFGKIYLWLGIKDTVEAATGFPLLDAIYFSAVTWTTLGYGDIVPSPAARPVAAIEALAGYVVMSLMIAALIAMVQPD